MATDMGRGILAPDSNDNISTTGVQEMRTLGATAAAAIADADFKRGVLPEGTDLDNFLTPGNHTTGDTVHTQTHTNLAVPEASNLMVLGAGTRFFASQIQIPVNGAGRIFFRTKFNSTTWTPWVNLANGQFPAPPPSGSHPLRVQSFKDDYPLVSTEGKGAVVFRYDHGLTNLKSSLLPLHEQHNIPLYVAMNSRLWNDAENSGASHADARAWINAGIAEFGNHTADHRDRNTAEGIYDNIVNGRKELEDQLQTIIHGFTVPGLSEYNAFEGFGGGSLDSYSDTYAGGLILANHAVCSGTMGSTLRPLDGQVRQGGRHYTWEARSWENIKTQIDNAVAQKSALTLMAHPKHLGTSGYFDTALADQVITYVRELINGGQLADISYYQSHHATTE